MPQTLAAQIARELITQFGATSAVQRIAEQAGRFLELAEAAREEVARDGVTLRVKSGRFRHPAVEIERTMRLAYLQVVRQLEAPRRSKVGKPPMGEALSDATAERARRFFTRTA
jgi:hypothetical protein